MDQQRQERLAGLLTVLQQRWGTDALRPLSTLSSQLPRIGLQTGFEVLDAVLGTQGIPRGQTTEIVGRLTSGATTLVYKAIAAAQREQLNAIYVDVESSFNPIYAKQCGINAQQLFLARPETEFNVLEIARDLIEQGSVGIIVMDMGESPLNVHDFRRLAGVLSRSGCVVLLLRLIPKGISAQDLLRTSPSELRLLVERDAWVEQKGAIQGYRSSVLVLGRHQAVGKRVTIEIAADLDGDVL